MNNPMFASVTYRFLNLFLKIIKIVNFYEPGKFMSTEVFLHRNSHILPRTHKIL